MNTYNLNESTKSKALEREPRLKKQPLPLWNKVVVSVIITIVLLVAGSISMDYIAGEKRAKESNLSSRRLTESMTPKARLMIQQLRTKAKQLEKKPQASIARYRLDDFIRDTERYIRWCDDADGYSSIKEVFVIANRKLSSFKSARYDKTEVIVFINKFEDTADEMEVALDSLVNK